MCAGLNTDHQHKAIRAFFWCSLVRRSEAAALTWDDVDLETGTAIIRHGKGDKRQEVAIIGDFAIAALSRWGEQIDCIGPVFRKMNNRGSILAKGISVDNIYRIVKQTEKLSGIEFSPHDLRRTWITDALANGAALADAQKQAGHANEAT